MERSRILIHEGKVLLIKHKKLTLWLNPGGHIDEGELPHEAAEREFLEETGVKVKAIDALSLPSVGTDFSIKDPENDTKFMPNPIATNLHWVNKESYDLRLKSENLNKRVPTKVWKRGCEHHVGFFFLLKLVDGIKIVKNEEEIDEVKWFTLEELNALETKESVKEEIKLGFKFLGIK